MRLTSVNIGRERTFQHNDKTFTSGIYKEPVHGPAQINTLGLDGDVIKNGKHHGGVDQAVYIYGSADYDWWASELDLEITPGTFGENLTISGLESADFQIGDRLKIGNVILEVTAPRIPCGTFAARMGDSGFAKKFRQAERPGLYCRVIQLGQVEAGQKVTVERHKGETVSILESYRDHYDPDESETGLRRFLAAPIDIRTRKDLEAKLNALLEKD